MKRAILILVLYFSFCFMHSSAQAPNWLWAKSAVGTIDDWGYGISTDIAGNVLITGYFYSDSITFGTTTLSNAGTSTQDIFIVKYDASGNVLWAVSVGGSGNDYGFGIATDAGGNVLVTGRYNSSSITFGTTILTNTSAGQDDIFIVKYDGSGNVVWAKSEGGTGNDRGFDIVADTLGNIYLTGQFSSSSITFGTTVLTSTGLYDIFLVKYDASGNVLWAKSAGGTDNDRGYAISTDAGGNVYLVGDFESSSITFGTSTFTNANAGYNDMFIAKYDALGNVLWANSSGGTHYDYAYGISIDNVGNVYVTGQFASDSIIFGAIALTNIYVGSYDVYIIKYDALGNALWAKSGNGPGADWGMGICTDAIGNVFLTGRYMSDTLTFGSTTLINVYAGYYDIYIVNYDASGNLLWARSDGNTSSESGNGMAIDAVGNIYLTGYFYSSPLIFGTTTLTNAGNGDVFISKLASTTGLSENIIESSFSLSPNPATDYITIQFNVSFPKETTVSLFNVYGQKVKSELAAEGKQEIKIDVQNFPSGVYLFNLTNKKTGERMNGKIVVSD